MKKRKYTLKQRARQQDETRQRIIEAAMELHGEVGPARTNISAIAERAGVQRLTVYRHFDDEETLFHACSSLWLEHHPLPDPATWTEIEDPKERINKALKTLYDYYAATESMWHKVYRDLDEVPALGEPMAAVAAYLTTVKDNLMPPGLTKAQRWQLSATLVHALQFTTWQSLSDQGLENRNKVGLVLRWLGS